MSSSTRRDRYTVINTLVSCAADSMESKIEEEAFIIEVRLEKYGAEDPTVKILRERAERTKQAVALMRENEGCWC